MAKKKKKKKEKESPLTKGDVERGFRMCAYCTKKYFRVPDWYHFCSSECEVKWEKEYGKNEPDDAGGSGNPGEVETEPQHEAPSGSLDTKS